ncbi:accessory gene regulator ArgB-like protein [Desulfosporosinus sp. BICA1-9]|uniref:accessory gene regulator ArgB-like protein n=1 Tax=Desulfosporosinus sp. BICA1-9 TaxID=1531958 RepID=UPI00054C6649|nr:accessory gene regulator B family protein [Desulfosporosinus sp. BICA1-9]KJS46418.1 MAG: accessory gene regulator AgrB [Peptococcaceae bacterium BRH_c23]KJS84065.1 MAG: accessory gene regulator AgrB [Desulfosporosinus sp. BICA1-9]HBW35111.1 accessory regulator AgrB [Desulfosporosinus sp.]
MNFTENISNKLTEVITNELNYNEDKKVIIAYAIETALLFVLGSFFLMILGYYFNALMPTVIAAIFGGLLRKVSGGAHFDSPVKCLAFGTIVYSSIGVFVKKYVEYDLTNEYVLFFVLFISLLLVAFLAPVDSESKPIHSSSLKFKLKISSIVFVIISFIVISFVDNKLVSVSVVLGVVYQSLTLLPIFNRRGGECRL